MCLSPVNKKPNTKIKDGFKVFIYENSKICGLYWSYFKLNGTKYIASKIYCNHNIEQHRSGIPVKHYPQGQWISAVQEQRLFSDNLTPYNSGFHFLENLQDAKTFIEHYKETVSSYKKHFTFSIEDYPVSIFAIETKQIVASGTELKAKCHVAKQIKIGEEVKWETEQI